MLARIDATAKHVCNLLRDRSAGVAPLVALAAVPLIASLGAAIDYSRVNALRSSMQNALDAAALVLSQQAKQLSSDQLTQQASTYFNGNFVHPQMQNLAVTATTSSQSGGSSVSMTAAGSVTTLFLGVMGISTINVSAQSSAYAASDGLGCVLSLDTTASGAITAQGNTTVNLNGCSLYDNSKSSSALTVGGSAALSALSVGVVGGISGSAGITVTQGIRTGLGAVSDPYVDYAYPKFSGCDQQKFTAKTTMTISPGVYCDGISLNSGANVTLSSGIYYIDGGGLSVNGGATLTGDGVTLVLTKKSGNSWPTVSINGNATVNLTPPKASGSSTVGIVVFGDRSIPVGTAFKFNGGANQYLAGAIYIPTGAITFAGGANTGTSCTQIIGDTVTFVGNSSLAINCSSFGTKPFSPTVVRLST